jgi:hypothetical protein
MMSVTETLVVTKTVAPAPIGGEKGAEGGWGANGSGSGSGSEGNWGGDGW